MTPAQKAGWKVGDIGWFNPGRTTEGQLENEPVKLIMDDGTGNPHFEVNLFDESYNESFLNLERVYRSKEQDLEKLRVLLLLGIKE